MQLTIELSPEHEAALKAKADAVGITPEALAKKEVEDGCESWMPRVPSDDERPIWEVITHYVESLPAETFADMPVDGASQHDHYLYGSPKRQQ